MPDERSKKVDVKPDKTVFKSLALGGLLGGGGECVVGVTDPARNRGMRLASFPGWPRRLWRWPLSGIRITVLSLRVCRVTFTSTPATKICRR